MQIINEVKLDFDDVLIRPKRSKIGSRSSIKLDITYKTLNSKREWTGLPIFASNMDAVGTLKMAEVFSEFNMLTCLHKFYSQSILVNFFKNNFAAKNTFYTCGVIDEDLERLKSFKNNHGPIDKICVDVANGYSEFFLDRVKVVREWFPNAIIMAGNVCTPEMVQELLISGAADIIKIGVGPGSVCETRTVTGVGYPQLSAIIECAEAAHGLGGLICADGGCRIAGDVVKAFGAGADFVMLGGMLAGHDECEGEWDNCTFKKSFRFYGMSSREAMEKYVGGVADYRASEGKSIEVPYKGKVKTTIQTVLGGIRSACAYVGASRLKDLSKCTTFVRCSPVSKVR